MSVFTLSASDYVSAVRSLYSKYADPVTAAPMEKYMKHHFPFYGIKSPLRSELDKQLFAQYGHPPAGMLSKIMRLLWQEDKREMQLHGLMLAERYMKKKFIASLPDDILTVFEECIVQRSWWDTVDYLAARLVGRYLMFFPELISANIERWIASPNMWLNRTAILFQLGYKSLTDVELLFSAIRAHAGSKEFFHRKAIGWALREYAKTAPETVLEFVKQTPLQPLSVREATKHFVHRAH